MYGHESRIVISPSAMAVCLRRLKATVVEMYGARLLQKPEQGEVFDATARHKESNHFFRSGGYTRFADWRLIYPARLDMLPSYAGQ